jgi:hypothetical protein
MKPQVNCSNNCSEAVAEARAAFVSNRDVVDHNLLLYLRGVERSVEYKPTEQRETTARHLNWNRKFKRSLEDMRCASAGGDPQAVDATLGQIFKKTLSQSPDRKKQDKELLAKANGLISRLDIERLG